MNRCFTSTGTAKFMKKNVGMIYHADTFYLNLNIFNIQLNYEKSYSQNHQTNTAHHADPAMPQGDIALKMRAYLSREFLRWYHH